LTQSKKLLKYYTIDKDFMYGYIIVY